MLTEKDIDKAKYQPPQTETAKQIAKIWQDVLNIKKIGLRDNFFDLGGHSLKAIRVLSQINHTFKIDLPLKILFQCPELGELTNKVEEMFVEDNIKINK